MLLFRTAIPPKAGCVARVGVCTYACMRVCAPVPAHVRAHVVGCRVRVPRMHVRACAYIPQACAFSPACMPA